ncbi:MAG: transposase [Myxococcota bacterium]|nr:transposase [Deltaproteobacteria bacterium]MDQ3340631.1 transposase [Myxococcota bacterium]
MFEQLGLDLTARTWGGKREGAGRKKSGTRDPSHRPRPKHVARNPLHVVLRVKESVGRLRRREVYAGAHRALLQIAARIAFRVVHMSIQHNHLHLLVEAADNDALESGMRALTISLAKRINKSLGRSGKVFEHRYHSTPLTSPRQTRNALAYVLNNWRRHREDERGFDERTMPLDPYSSAISFRGWADFSAGVDQWPDVIDEPLPVSPPQTWLLGVGWELAKRSIRTSDTPGPID